MNKPEGNQTIVKKYGSYFFAVLPLVVLGIYFFSIYQPTFYLFSPNKKYADNGFNLSAYTDLASQGNSVIKLDTLDNGKLIYSYQLKEGYMHPYVGVYFQKKDSSLFDLSNYTRINIKLKASKGKRVPLTLTTNIQGYSDIHKPLSFRNCHSVLPVSTTLQEIEVSFNELETPDWWYTLNNKTEKDIASPDFANIRTIQFGNCINIDKGVADTIEIEELSFDVNYLPFFLNAGAFLGLYYVIGFLIIRKRKKVLKTEVNFQYEKTNVVNQEDKEEEAIFNYITTHYVEAELTIIDIQQALGIHERKISAIIKKKTDLNFKQFLNKLRISEAKRLLVGTNLQISEIAFKVGYSNASHFNRVFKTEEDCSPNDFRKDHPIA